MKMTGEGVLNQTLLEEIDMIKGLDYRLFQIAPAL
jgi:hypothetical protein